MHLSNVVNDNDNNNNYNNLIIIIIIIIKALKNYLITNLDMYKNTIMFEKGENIMTFVEHIIPNLPWAD